MFQVDLYEKSSLIVCERYEYKIKMSSAAIFVWRFKARFHVEVSTGISIRDTQILHCALG